jgi:hypothetical protein
MSISLKIKYPNLKFIYSKTEDSLFQCGYDKHFKETLYLYYGLNLPSQGLRGKTNVVCDKNTSSYWFTAKNGEYHQIAHYCVHAYGSPGLVYSWELLLDGISKLTFVKQKSATSWNTSSDYDTYYCINKKHLKKWFKRNHNRLLCPVKLFNNHLY